jgi:O-antigen/teichoic acid export membrane protein
MQVRKLIGDSAVYGVSNIAIKLISLILFPLFARKFSPETYGVISILSTMNLFLLALSPLGLDMAATRLFFDKEKDKNQIFATWFYFQLLVTIVIFLIVAFCFSSYISSTYLKIKNGHFLIMIVLLNLFLSILPSILNISFILNKAPFKALLRTVLLTLISAISSLILVFYYDFGVWGFFLGQTIGFFIISIIGLFHFRKALFHFSLDVPLLKEMVNYGIRSVPGYVSNQLFLFFSSMVIQRFTSQESLGYFQVAYTLASGLLIFTSGFAQAFVPQSLSYYDNKEELTKFCTGIFRIYTAAMSLICLSIGIFYYEIVHILLTSKYLGSVVIAGILTYSNFVISLNAIANTGLLVTKSVTLQSKILVISNGINLLLLVIFTKYFGVVGSAFSYLIAQSLSVFLTFRFSQKEVYMPYSFKESAAVIGLSFSLFGVITLLHIDRQLLLVTIKLLVISSFAVLLLRLYPSAITYLRRLSNFSKTHR